MIQRHKAFAAARRGNENRQAYIFGRHARLSLLNLT